MRGGSGIVRFSRSGNAGVCGASACAAACRSSMRRPLRKNRTHRRFFSPVGAKACPCSAAYGMPLCARHFRKAGVHGRSLRLCAGKCGIDCRRSTRKSPTAKPKRPSRFRPSPLRVSARRIGKRRGKKRKSGFRCERKNVCGAQPQTLIVHPFFSRRGRTEG